MTSNPPAVAGPSRGRFPIVGLVEAGSRGAICEKEGNRVEIFSRKWTRNGGEETTIPSRMVGYGSRAVGPSVEEAWGDDDYEYWMEFSPEDVRRLIPHFLKHLQFQRAAEVSPHS